MRTRAQIPDPFTPIHQESFPGQRTIRQRRARVLTNRSSLKWRKVSLIQKLIPEGAMGGVQ